MILEFVKKYIPIEEFDITDLSIWDELLKSLSEKISKKFDWPVPIEKLKDLKYSLNDYDGKYTYTVRGRCPMYFISEYIVIDSITSFRSDIFEYLSDYAERQEHVLACKNSKCERCVDIVKFLYNKVFNDPDEFPDFPEKRDYFFITRFNSPNALNHGYDPELGITLCGNDTFGYKRSVGLPQDITCQKCSLICRKRSEKERGIIV